MTARRPSIDVAPVRELKLVSHPEGRAPHVCAASGIVRTPAATYVIADDELHLAVFPNDAGPGELRRLFPGTLPLDPVARKQAKPDLEALTILPKGAAHPNGALVGLGSGSTARRARGFVWPLDAHGALEGAARIIDLAPLYQKVRAGIPGQLNIEGATASATTLRLFQRGNSRHGKNMAIDVALDKALAEIDRTGTIGAAAMSGIRTYDLGKLEGVPLTFADARMLPDGRTLFLATAERTDNVIDDGEIIGSTIGVIEPSSRLGEMWHINAPGAKLEGVELLPPAGAAGPPALKPGARVLFAADADNPAKPSVVLQGTVPDASPASDTPANDA